MFKSSQVFDLTCRRSVVIKFLMFVNIFEIDFPRFQIIERLN